MHLRKGQAAMEFLMTYGWAILVVLAAIGALAYFGILSPSKFLPSSCTITGGFSCTEYKVTENTVTVGIQNNLGVGAKNIFISLTDCNTTYPLSGTPDPAVTANGAKITGTSLIFTCDTGTEGNKFKTDISIVYERENEDLNHTATGNIQANVEG